MPKQQPAPETAVSETDLSTITFKGENGLTGTVTLPEIPNVIKASDVIKQPLSTYLERGGNMPKAIQDSTMPIQHFYRLYPECTFDLQLNGEAWTPTEIDINELAIPYNLIISIFWRTFEVYRAFNPK